MKEKESFNESRRCLIQQKKKEVEASINKLEEGKKKMVGRECGERNSLGKYLYCNNE